MFLFLFSQRENPRALNRWDSETPALSTCSNADIFRRMNTMLGNSLDLTGVCTTPSAKTKRDSLMGNVVVLLAITLVWKGLTGVCNATLQASCIAGFPLVLCFAIETSITL